ncbi:hypothetical protein [Bradyrhizobium sp. USDA 3256]
MDFKKIPLVELVQGLLRPDRLRMEEIERSDLVTLLRQLKISIKLIEDKMA